ncbi:MAG TPA: sugar ABC transporter permease [Trueperaceae bacterium]
MATRQGQPTLPRRRSLPSAARRRLFAFSLLAPAAAIVLLVILYPLVMAARISFHDVRVFQAAQGIQGPATIWNYQDMFGSADFWHALKVSLYYVFFGTLGSLAIGLCTALLLNQRFRGRVLARVLLVLPWPIPGVVAALIFMWMFNASYGVINYFLLKLHLVSAPINWFTQPIPALVAVLVATIWKGYPFFTVTLLAGMQSIPGELYEAARVDGANPSQQLRFITLPALRPVIGIGLVISSLWLFRAFEYIFVMTGGGPSRSTETLSIQIYKEAFAYFHMGYAAAVGMVTLVISVLVTLFYLRYISKDFY